MKVSKWSHVDAIIKYENEEGVKQILEEQQFETKPWKHFNNPYSSLVGSEGDAEFYLDVEDKELRIRGDLRDVGKILEDKEQIIKDFKQIIDKVNGKGYIEIEYDYEGTIVVEYYGEKIKYRIFPQPDGWNVYYKEIVKK